MTNRFLIILMASIAFLLSCSEVGSDSPKNNYIALESNSEIYAAIVGKWDIDDKNSPYESFEFTEQGYYIVVEKKNTHSNKQQAFLARENSLLANVHHGKFRIDNGKVVLEDFGEIKEIEFDAENFRISFTYDGTEFSASGTAENTSQNTAKLSRVWILQKVTTDEAGTTASTGVTTRNLTAMWSKAGTYLVIYNNQNGLATNANASLSEWEWTDEAGGVFAYSWDNWQTKKDINIVTVNDENLIIKEDENYFHFELLSIAVEIIGNAAVGEQLTANIIIPDLVGKVDCDIDYQWKANGSPVGTNSNKYTLQPEDGAKDIMVDISYTCEDYIMEGGVASSGNTVVKPQSPTITTQPEDMVLADGASGELSVVATCAAGTTLKYAWFNGGDVATKSITGNKDLESQEFYVDVYCTLSGLDSDSKRSRTAVIRTPSEPEITSPITKKCAVDIPCEITVSATANGDLTYSWRDGSDSEVGAGTTFDAGIFSTAGNYTQTVVVINTIEGITTEKRLDITIEVVEPTLMEFDGNRKYTFNEGFYKISKCASIDKYISCEANANVEQAILEYDGDNILFETNQWNSKLIEKIAGKKCIENSLIYVNRNSIICANTDFWWEAQ